MEIVRKILYFAASLIFTVSLMYLGVSQYRTFKEGHDILAEREMLKMEEIYKYPILRYDNRDIDGAKVISYIKENAGKTTIYVTTSKKTFVADSSMFSGFTDSASDYYIVPTKLYSVKCTENGNGVISSVTITVK